MHDIAMAALSVFLTQSLAYLALLAPVPTRPACRSAPLGDGMVRPAAHTASEGPG